MTQSILSLDIAIYQSLPIVITGLKPEIISGFAVFIRG